MEGYTVDPLGQGLWAAGLEFAAVQEFRVRPLSIQPELKLEGDKIYFGARFQLVLSSGRRVCSHLTVINGTRRPSSSKPSADFVGRLAKALSIHFELGDGPPIPDQRVDKQTEQKFLHRVLLECNVHKRMAILLAEVRRDVILLWPSIIEKNRRGAQFHVSLDRFDV